MTHTVKGFGTVNRAEVDVSLSLENPMDGGAWWAAAHGVTQSQTRLSDFTFTFPFHALEKEMATHSSVLAWRIPGTGEPGGLPSMGSHRVRHDWGNLAAGTLLFFSMIQRMLAIWSLVPLSFLNPAWISGSARFRYCWSLAWRILSITLIAHEMRRKGKIYPLECRVPKNSKER